MNTYLLSIYFLFIAALSQAAVGALAFKFSLQRDLPAARWRMWVAFSISALLLALHHGNTLHLAAKSGLYDFRQAILAMLAGLATSYVVWLLRPPKP